MYSLLFVLVSNLAALQAIFVRTFLTVLGAPVLNWFSNNRTVYLMSSENLKLVKPTDTGSRKVEFEIDPSNISQDVVKAKIDMSNNFLTDKSSETWLRDKRGSIETIVLSYKKSNDPTVFYAKISVKSVTKDESKYIFKGKFSDSDSEYIGDIIAVRFTMYLVNDADNFNSWWNSDNLSLGNNVEESECDSDSD